ncbi:MAG: hypothetical protein JW827_02525 [Spirochaetes bacterium]|nr:hypothetical protein [Spirochaetota bacterium]
MKHIFLLLLILCIPLTAHSKIVYMNWYWGVEKIGSADYFIFNLLPEFKKNSVSFQLEIPVEVNSNVHIREKEYDGWEDIIPKIKYLQYKQDDLSIRMSSLENIGLGNRSLVFNYANDLFDTYLRKRGLLVQYKKDFFGVKGMIDNVMDWDIFALNLDSHFHSWEIGISSLYDTDTGNPYSERPEDGQGPERAWIDININFLIDLTPFRIKLLNDLVREFSSAAGSDNFRISSGPQIQIKPVRFTSLIKYNQNVDTLLTPINHFYEIERSCTDMDKRTGFGYTLIFELSLADFLSMELGLEQAEKTPVSFSVGLETGDDFYTGFHTSITLFNRRIDKWYRMLEETPQNTHLKMVFTLPLSKHLDLGLVYIKSFMFKNDHITPLRISMITSSFHF